MTPLTHEEAATLRTDHPGAWGLGVADAQRDLRPGGFADGRAEQARQHALYEGDRAALPAFRAYWAGYAAGIVRYSPLQ